MFLSAFASLTDPVSRTYYQRKRDQGKRHNQALLALTHRRIPTLHAMTRNQPRNHPQPLDTPHRGTPPRSFTEPFSPGGSRGSPEGSRRAGQAGGATAREIAVVLVVAALGGARGARSIYRRVGCPNLLQRP